jgi:hypothetical protein
MSCGIIDCDNKGFWVDWETSKYLEGVDLICYKCNYRRHLSIEKYRSMVDIDNLRLMQCMKYGIGWDDIFLIKKERIN